MGVGQGPGGDHLSMTLETAFAAYEAVRHRLMEYYKKTSPLIGYYYAKGDLKTVDGLGEIDAVKADIAAALNT